MDKILPMLLVSGIVVIIFGSSYRCERRVQKFTDEFCKAFLEASDHILNAPMNGEMLRYTVDTSAFPTSSLSDKRGKAIRSRKTLPIKLSNLEEQPEALRKLLEKGIDDFVVERFQTMHIKRDGAQLNLNPFNMIEKRYNCAMNRIYEIAAISFRALEDFSVLKTQEDIDDFHFFLHKQDFIRNTILTSIISKDAKNKMSGFNHFNS